MDLSEYIEHGIDEFKKNISSELNRIGVESVDVAKSSTAYHDVTGRLRSSNHYQADENGLRIYNDAPYASNVEARCGNVIADAVLFAKNELSK